MGHEEMSVGQWMITLLLLFIPIVNIVMLVIWATGNSKASENIDLQNFARASLIWMAIGVALTIVLTIIIASLGAMVLSEMNPPTYY